MRHEEVVWKNGQYVIVRKKPSLCNLLQTKLRKSSFHENLRWLIQLPFGYRVYILKSKATGAEIAYCFVSNGVSPRYPFASKNDIIVGPYFVAESERRNGIAFLIVSKCLTEIEKGYSCAWDFIQHSNTASISTSKKVGFVYYSDCKYSKYLRILRPVEEHGQEMLFKFEGEKYNA